MTDTGEIKQPKRGQGEGWFKVLPSGRVQWRVMVTSKAGERRHVSGTARNLTEARKAVREIREAAERDSLPPREKMTIEALVSEYITHRAPALKQHTLDDYHGLLRRYIAPSIGTLKAQGVSAERLRLYFTELSEPKQGQRGKGQRTIEQVHGLLRAAYKHGVNEGLVTVNPTLRAKPVKKRSSGPDKLKAFTPEQAAAFYRTARPDRWGWPLVFMLATGLRLGEVLGLMWQDVERHPDGSVTISIERTRSVSAGKVYENTPKTQRGRRKVKVQGDAATMLGEVKARTDKEAGARLTHNGHAYQGSNYVFVTRAGTGYRPDNLRRPFRRLCELAGVPVLNPYALRHTYTSVLAAAGVSLEVLSAQLGHENSATTGKFYRTVFAEEREGLTYDPT